MRLWGVDWLAVLKPLNAPLYIYAIQRPVKHLSMVQLSNPKTAKTTKGPSVPQNSPMPRLSGASRLALMCLDQNTPLIQNSYT